MTEKDREFKYIELLYCLKDNFGNNDLITNHCDSVWNSHGALDEQHRCNPLLCTR